MRTKTPYFRQLARAARAELVDPESSNRPRIGVRFVGTQGEDDGEAFRRWVASRVRREPVVVLANDRNLLLRLDADLCEAPPPRPDNLWAACLEPEGGELRPFLLWHNRPPVKSWTSFLTLGLFGRRPDPLSPFAPPGEVALRRPTEPLRLRELGEGARVKARGRRLTLGPPVGRRSGEGRVFEVVGRPGEVCKVYRPGRATRESVEKLELMLTREVRDPAVCWPRAFVVDPKTRGVCGFLMPRARADGLPITQGLHAPGSSAASALPGPGDSRSRWP
jgi:hypothetical protein